MQMNDSMNEMHFMANNAMMMMIHCIFVLIEDIFSKSVNSHHALGYSMLNCLCFDWIISNRIDCVFFLPGPM